MSVLDWLERQPTRRCLGPLNEALPAVLARMVREAERAEERAERLVAQARAELEEGQELVAVPRAEQLRKVAAKHRATAKEAEASKARGTGAAIGRLLAIGRNGEAAHLKRIAHAGCGADLNPVIFAEVPEDGESHDYACPKCGMQHHATRIPAPAVE